jgi:hypothetical protein
MKFLRLSCATAIICLRDSFSFQPSLTEKRAGNLEWFLTVEGVIEILSDWLELLYFILILLLAML